MKKLFIAVLLMGGGYYLYTHHYSQAVNYSLAEVEQKPIPKQYFYKLWNERALQTCADAKSRHNLTPEECRAKIDSKSSSCEANFLPTTPEKIGNTNQAKSLGKAYLACVIPYFYCNGIEVKTEEEARQHCK